MAASLAIPKPTTARKRKYNCKKVVRQAMEGIGPAMIARENGVAISTITRYLDSIGLTNQELEKYKKHRPDLKALIGMKGEEKILEIIPTICAEQLKPSEKNGALMALNAIVGTRHQEERLETDQSTSNTAVLVAGLRDLQSRKRGGEPVDK